MKLESGMPHCGSNTVELSDSSVICCIYTENLAKVGGSGRFSLNFDNLSSTFDDGCRLVDLELHCCL